MNTSMHRPADIPQPGSTVLSTNPGLSVASTAGAVEIRGDWPANGGARPLSFEEAHELAAALEDHADRVLLNSLTDTELADCRHAAQVTLRRVVCGIRARRVAADRFTRSTITTAVDRRDGAEYVCVPLAEDDDVPSLLRAVADAWEAENVRRMTAATA